MRAEKKIIGYPNYKVDIFGRVFSIKNNIYLSPQVNHITGYLCVTILNKKGRMKFLVHRLVAQAFIPNPGNKPCVNHLDGNKSNNDISNLEWVTYSENIAHAYRTGIRVTSDETRKKLSYNSSLKCGERNGKSTMVLNIYTGIYYGSIAEAAKSCGKDRNSLRISMFKRKTNRTSFISCK